MKIEFLFLLDKMYFSNIDFCLKFFSARFFGPFPTYRGARVSIPGTFLLRSLIFFCGERRGAKGARLQNQAWPFPLRARMSWLARSEHPVVSRRGGDPTLVGRGLAIPGSRRGPPAGPAAAAAATACGNRRRPPSAATGGGDRNRVAPPEGKTATRKPLVKKPVSSASAAPAQQPPPLGSNSNEDKARHFRRRRRRDFCASLLQRWRIFVTIRADAWRRRVIADDHRRYTSLRFAMQRLADRAEHERSWREMNQRAIWFAADGLYVAMHTVL